jgi:lipid-A-disaccharide synthase
MVIGYTMNALTWMLMKRMAYQPWFGLPNILEREFVVPERIQEHCHAAQLERDVLEWLDDAPRRDRLAVRFADLHHRLRQDTARRATDALAHVFAL